MQISPEFPTRIYRISCAQLFFHIISESMQMEIYRKGRKKMLTIPLVMTVPEMAEILQIGRNAAYDLVKSGAVRSIRIGRNIRIPQAALLDYLNRK